jgi:hypothetical protein
MIHARCLSTELLLERKTPALSHAERLKVEEHLAECERCRRDHRAMVELMKLADDRVTAAMRSGAQERAISRALARSPVHGGRHRVGELGRSRSALRVTLALAAAFAVALLATSLLRNRTRHLEPSLAMQGTAPTDRIVSGDVVLGAARLEVGAAVPPDTELLPRGAFGVQLAHARLSVTTAGAFRWTPATRTVALRDAIVDVSVDPEVHRSFRIVTPHFLVDVVGTVFRVDRDTVGVTRGRVRVLAPQTEELLAELGPGGSWSYHEPVPSVPADVTSSPFEPPTASSSRGETTAQLSGAELLVRARHRLAEGDARGARADVVLALSSRLNTAEQAEAHMLQGDCALVGGDPATAVRRYLDVSRRFGGLKAGETALFAAARVESNAGHRASARDLLETYLRRYPTGQFRSDAEDRLRLLGPKE